MKKLKNLLSPSIYAFLRDLAYKIKIPIMIVCAKSRVLSALYYSFFSRAFRREQQSVLSGAVRYLSKKDELSSFYLLRRNTHRIEKGILMKPRRPSFALDYLEETVNCYIRCIESNLSSRFTSDIHWSRNVLEKYFSITESSTLRNRMLEKFTQHLDDCNNSGEVQMVPYNRLLEEQPVTYDALWKLARQRRSVRWFIQKEVPRELLDKAVLLASQSPSSCNRQPYKYWFFDSREQVENLVKLPIGTGGFDHNIPVFGVVTGDLSAFFSERDRHGIYVDSSLSIMAFMFALETLGLSSCPLNWPDIEFRERKMAKELKLDKHERVIMCMAIGWPDLSGQVAFSQKQPLNELRTYNLKAVSKP